MSRWTPTFLLGAAAAGLLAFTGLAGPGTDVAKIAFLLCLMGAFLSLATRS